MPWCLLNDPSFIARHRKMTEISSFVTGHHIYRRIWSPTLGEELVARRNRDNEYDARAIGVYRFGVLVGHAPREIRDRLLEHLRMEGSITVIVTGGRGNSRNRGLEVPALYCLDWLTLPLEHCWSHFYIFFYFMLNVMLMIVNIMIPSCFLIL